MAFEPKTEPPMPITSTVLNFLNLLISLKLKLKLEVGKNELNKLELKFSSLIIVFADII